MPATAAVRLTAERRQRVAHGDWQTPRGLAEQVLELVGRAGKAFQAVLEPTCGTGSFLSAAARAFPEARLLGFDRSPEYIEIARRELGERAELRVGDCFELGWERVVADLPEPLLLLGNPPWVTSATLGALSVRNFPAKSNFKQQSGYDALTGKSNFDVSEWILLRLLEAARGRHFTLAMLVKSAVARRVIERAAALGSDLEGALYGVDARANFAAAVASSLLVLRSGAARGTGVAPAPLRIAVYASLAAREPVRYLGVQGGRAYGDLDLYHATSALEGKSELTWRSGVKHDLARVMELRERDGALVNGAGEPVHIESDFVYPLCKGSDLARGTLPGSRFVIVTQEKLGDDTSRIREAAPATWRYLEAHRAAFEARKSRIYRGQPPFAMFGVGPYTFAPYKVAISALHKKLTFRVVAPVDARPVVLDDTSYFLPCESLEQAERLARALTSPLATRYLEARVFWDDKRPITKALLGSLSLERLLECVEAGESSC